MKIEQKKGIWSRFMEKVDGFNYREAQAQQQMQTRMTLTAKRKMRDPSTYKKGNTKASETSHYSNVLLTDNGLDYEDTEMAEVVDFEDLVEQDIDTKFESNYLIINATHWQGISQWNIKASIIVQSLGILGFMSVITWASLLHLQDT